MCHQSWVYMVRTICRNPEDSGVSQGKHSWKYGSSEMMWKNGLQNAQEETEWVTILTSLYEEKEDDAIAGAGASYAYGSREMRNLGFPK